MDKQITRLADKPSGVSPVMWAIMSDSDKQKVLNQEKRTSDFFNKLTAKLEAQEDE